MNWAVFTIILVLTIIMAIIEYSRSERKGGKAVVVLVLGVIISCLSGSLFYTTPKEPEQVFDFQAYYEEQEKNINNFIYHREYDRALDYLTELADTAKSTYGSTSLELGKIYALIGRYYNYLADPINAEKYVGYAKSIVLQYTPDHNNYLEIATIYKSCGDADSEFVEAEYFYHIALDIMSNFNDTASQLTASIYANLADRYSNANEHVKALECAEKAQNLYKAYRGPVTTEVGVTYCALGNIYAGRNYTKAQEYYEKAEAIFRNNEPNDDSYLAICYSGMANLYTNIDLEKSYDYAHAAWELNNSLFGELHENTIKSEISLAVFYRISNDLGHAKQILEEALLKAEEKYGTTSQVSAEIYIELGNTTDSLQESLAYYDQAELIEKNLHGERHLNVAFIYANKAMSYYDNGDLIKALEFYNKAVSIYTEKGGSFSDELAYLYLFRGDFYYYEEDEYDKAVRKYEEAQQIYDTLYGPSNINSALCAFKTARLYSYIGDKPVKEVDRLFSSALEIYEMTYGEDSFQNAELYHEYAKHVWLHKSDPQMAIRYAQKAVELASIDQPNSLLRAKYCCVLGEMYFNTGKAEMGFETLKECIRIIEYRDQTPPVYIEALSMLAQRYSTVEEERALALWYIDKTVAAAKKAGGAEDLCAAYYHTAIALGNLGEYETALEYLDFAQTYGIKVYAEDDPKILNIYRYREMIQQWFN